MSCEAEFGEPWSVWGVDPDIAASGRGLVARFTGGRSEEMCLRAIACVNALAGLEPADVEKLVGLVRRYLIEHDETAADEAAHSIEDCPCRICRDAHELLGRLPK